MIDYRAGHLADDRNDRRGPLASRYFHYRRRVHRGKASGVLRSPALGHLSDDGRTERRGAFIPPFICIFRDAPSTMERRAALGAISLSLSLSLSLCSIDYGSISFINLNRPRDHRHRVLRMQTRTTVSRSNAQRPPSTIYRGVWLVVCWVLIKRCTGESRAVPTALSFLLYLGVELRKIRYSKTCLWYRWNIVREGKLFL